jgi:hypothetical protein
MEQMNGDRQSMSNGGQEMPYREKKRRVKDPGLGESPYGLE